MYNDELMCNIESVFVDFKTHNATFNLHKDHCCDMRGAINYAKRIDPEIILIKTYSGDREDVVYVSFIDDTGVDKWEARYPVTKVSFTKDLAN